MTRLQVKLNFLSVKTKGASELIGKRLKVERGTEIVTSYGKLSHLASIEISLDGEEIFNSEDYSQGRKGKKLRISDYLLDPKDTVISVTIDEGTQPDESVDEEEVETQYPCVDTATGDSLPDPPDSEDNEEGFQEALLESVTGTTTESAVENEEQLTYEPLADNLAAAKDPAVCESKACGGTNSNQSASEIYGFEVATLVAKCRDPRKDAAMQTTPSYLIRFGARVMTSHKMPLAWPPMTDYKCAITFIEMMEVVGDSPQDHTTYVILLDGNDNVGIAYQTRFTPKEDYPLDMLMVFHLIESKKWLMRRPLIVVAESVQSNFITAHSKQVGGYKSIEQCIAQELWYCKERVHVCRDPMLIKMFKSLVFFSD